MLPQQDRHVRLTAARVTEVQIEARAGRAVDVAIITANYTKPTTGDALKAMGQQCH